jgi:hypothetical protein
MEILRERERERERERKAKATEDRGRTSFNILTLPINTPVCSSFWLSNSSNVALLYCPLLFGVALLYPPSLFPLPPIPYPPPPYPPYKLPFVLAPGYAEKPGPSDEAGDARALFLFFEGDAERL